MERDATTSWATIPIRTCYNYQEPHEKKYGCQCEGYEEFAGFVPYTTVNGTRQCSRSMLTTYTTTNPYPYTTTMSNGAIVAYSTTMDLGYGASVPSGAHTTISAGSSYTLQIGTTKSVPVGYLSADSQVSNLFVSCSIS